MSLSWNPFRKKMAGRGCRLSQMSVMYKRYKKGEDIESLRCRKTASPKKRAKAKARPYVPKVRSQISNKSFLQLKKLYEDVDDFEIKFREWTLVSDSSVTFDKHDNAYSVMIAGEDAGGRDPRRVVSHIVKAVSDDMPAGEVDSPYTKNEWETLLKRVLAVSSKKDVRVTTEIRY